MKIIKKQKKKIAEAARVDKKTVDVRTIGEKSDDNVLQYEAQRGLKKVAASVTR